jgi:hypothetical protein
MDQGHVPITSSYHSKAAYDLLDLKNQVESNAGYHGQCNIPLWDWSNWFAPYIQRIIIFKIYTIYF